MTATTSATAAKSVATSAGSWFKVAGGGLLAGLAAALAMTLTMAILRATFGLPTPAELIGDRVIPSLSLDQFFPLLARFGGANGLKLWGVGSVLAGQLVAGTLLGALYAVVVERGRRRQPERAWRFGISRRGWRFVAVAGGLTWLASVVLLWPVLGTSYRGLPPGPAAMATALGLALSYAAYGVALPLAYRALTQRAPLRQPAPLGRPLGRRAVLVGGAGVGLALASGGLLRLLYGRSTLGYDGLQYKGNDVEGVTPNDRFYTVTKNILDPDVAQPVWRLAVAGLVDRPRAYGLDDLATLPATTQETTLSCISNEVGGGLVSNAVWTGVPLRTLLEAAGPRGTIVDVVCRGADNYVDTIPFDKAMDPTTFVAWEMNGVPLPRRHGYPVRILVPGRFGEKSVKWVTRIELVDREVQGFYERQGWGPTFITPTLSRFDAPAGGQAVKLSAVAPTVKGIAFAGDRGIARVEVSADDGRTWQEARLDYQKSRLTWALWSHDWRPAQPGEYRLAVRAVDGTGAYQTSDQRGTSPDGATGYHRITVRVEA